MQAALTASPRWSTVMDPNASRSGGEESRGRERESIGKWRWERGREAVRMMGNALGKITH